MTQHHGSLYLPLGPLELLPRQAVARHGLQLAHAHVHHRVRLRRQTSGVDAEDAGVGERLGVGVDRVRQAALLAHFLKQPRTHPTTEGGAEYRHGVASLVPADQPGCSHHHVRLLGRPAQDAHRVGLPPTLAYSSSRCRVERRIQPIGEHLTDLAHDLGMVDVSGHRNNHAIRGVGLAVEATNRALRQSGDRVDGAENRSTQRRIPEHGEGEFVVHQLTRLVVIHRDLFEDHRSLGFDIVAGQRRVQHHITHDIKSHR